MHFEGNDLEVILDCVARRATHTKCYLQKSVYNDEKPIQYFDKISSLSLYAYPSGFIAFLSSVRKYFIFGIKCKLYFIVRFILLKPAPKKPRKKPEKPKQTNTKGQYQIVRGYKEKGKLYSENYFQKSPWIS